MLAGEAMAACVSVPTTVTVNGTAVAAPVVAGINNLEVGNNSYIKSTGTLNTSGNGTSMTTTSGVGPPGQTLPAFSPATFPSVGGTNQSINNGTLATGSYGDVTISGSNTFSDGNYFISKLKAGNNVTLTLAAGDYFINKWDVGNNFVLNVSSGPVRIFINTSFQAGNQSVFNSPGSTANLQFYAYNNAQMEFGNANNGNSDVDFNGLIYAPGSNTKIEFGNNNIIQGSVLSGGKVQLGNNTGVIFDAATQAAIASISLSGGSCAASTDHYELSLASNSISCLSTPITVTACADNSSPCANKDTSVSGKTATLATSGGTLGGATVTFDATGVASTTLSYPAAVDGTTVSVTLSNEQIAAANSRQCCPSGVSCAVANSCSSIFSSAGFIFSAGANGVATTISSQIAGVTSGAYYLRAVKTNTTTMACQSALTGAQSVNFGYECIDPTTCSAGNLMSVNGSAATANDNGSAINYLAIGMTFDANGNAPFTLNYSDVGQVKLWVNKMVSSAILTGSSNAFVVKTFDFGIVPCTVAIVGDCITPPADPGLAGGGGVFVKAGESFKATVTARTASGATTPNFGLGTNNATEMVGLAHNIVAPTGVGTTDVTLGGTTSITRSSFSNGVATVSNLSWGEVGVITLTATNGTFLGNALTTTGTSGNVGRFIPDHFDTVVKYDAASKIFMPCPIGLTCPASGDPYGNGFVYSGQPFTVQVTAFNLAGVKTSNYDGALGYAKAATLFAWNAAGGAAANPGGGAIASNTMLSSAFTGGVATTSTPVYTFPATPVMPTDIFVRADEPVGLDGVSSLRGASSVEGGIKIVSGRVNIPNAYGSELLDLPMTATVEYYHGTSWLSSATDSITSLTPSLSNYQRITGGTWTTASTPLSGQVTAGDLPFTLTKPTGGGTGSVDVSINAPNYLLAGSNVANNNPSNTARATFGIYKGNSKFIYIRELY